MNEGGNPRRRAAIVASCSTAVSYVVRRGPPAPSRPTAESDDDVADVEGLRHEVRRLRAELLAVQEQKRAFREAHRSPGAQVGGDAEEDPAGEVDVVTVQPGFRAGFALLVATLTALR